MCKISRAAFFILILYLFSFWINTDGQNVDKGNCIAEAADGTLVARFASEVPASAITALAGATLTLTRVL